MLDEILDCIATFIANLVDDYVKRNATEEVYEEFREKMASLAITLHKING